LTGIKESNETVSIVHGSNERSYIFYCHKFLLASIDLKSSEFAHSSPFEDEKRSYVHVLDNIAAHLIRTEGWFFVFGKIKFVHYLFSVLL
jgi:hypothetical protein